MSRYPKWTEKEKQSLRKLYPTIPAYEISKRIDRPESAIRIMAHRLNLKADRTLHWTHTWKFINSNPYKSLSREDLAYMSGIIDGEGFLDMDKRGFWRLGVGNTYKPLIDWLGNKIDYSTCTYRRSQNPKWKESWTWNLHGNLKVFALLKLLFPYLIVKKDKAIIAINNIEKRQLEL